MKANLNNQKPLSVAEFLRPLMAARDLSTSALARASNIDNSYLHRILDADHPISIEMSLRIAEVLDINAYEIATVQVRWQVYDYMKTARRTGTLTTQAPAAKPSRPARSRRRAFAQSSSFRRAAT
jgi:plasmid maintenance system antidote protein VapI